MHLRGKSNPVKFLTKERKRRPIYFYASRSRYIAKFYKRPGLWLANILWTSGRVISYIREIIGNKSEHVCKLEYRDIWTNWLHPIHQTGTHGAESQ